MAEPEATRIATLGAEESLGQGMTEGQEAANAHVELTTTGEAAQPEPRQIGLTIGLEVASAYCFRGLNVFQSDSQLDPHLLFAPALSYAVGQRQRLYVL